MPQFDLSTYASQIFWAAAAFLLLYIFISCWFVPRVSRLIFSRRNYFSNIDLVVKEMNSEIEKLNNEYNQKLQYTINDSVEFKDLEIARRRSKIDYEYKEKISLANKEFCGQREQVVIQLQNLQKTLDGNLSVLVKSIIHNYRVDISDNEINQLIGEKKNGSC